MPVGHDSGIDFVCPSPRCFGKRRRSCLVSCPLQNWLVVAVARATCPGNPKFRDVEGRFFRPIWRVSRSTCLLEGPYFWRGCRLWRQLGLGVFFAYATTSAPVVIIVCGKLMVINLNRRLKTVYRRWQLWRAKTDDRERGGDGKGLYGRIIMGNSCEAVIGNHDTSC